MESGISELTFVEPVCIVSAWEILSLRREWSVV